MEKLVGPPEYYLVNDFKGDSRGRWCMGCKKYIAEAVAREKPIFGILVKKDTPMASGDYPEMDHSEVLNEKGTCHQGALHLWLFEEEANQKD
eukprot:1480583-Ditylum_brightwellii.AAC.2